MSALDRLRRDESGFTLVEMLVAVVLTGIVGGVLMTMTVASRDSAVATTAHLDLTAEARTALNRMVTDLREATPLVSATTGTTTPAITAVSNPDGPSFNPSAVTSVTFDVDTSGDGCINGTASKNLSAAPSAAACPSTNAVNPNLPETESICWDPSTQQVYLLAIDPTTTNPSTPVTNCGGGVPLLAGKVSAFKVSYRSSQYLYQNASNQDPAPGMTTWYDLDAAGPPVGDRNQALDAAELRSIDSVVIDMTMTVGSRRQQFRTSTELRNVHPNG